MTILRIVQPSHFNELSRRKGKAMYVLSPLFTGEDDEDDELCHSARWQASEQLSAFLGTLHKPLSAFERKAITKEYPRPDVDCIYTPTLDNYLPSLLPGVKNVDKDNKCLQDRVLDSMGPIAMLFEHIYGFLAEAKPGENVILGYEQMKDLGAITSNAIRLLGNASALLSKKRRKAVINKINSKGTLSFLPQKNFRKLAKFCLGKDLKQGSRPDQRQQRPYFQLLLWGKIHDLLSSFEAAQPLQKTREPLGWCQSKVSKCQQGWGAFVQRSVHRG